MRTVLFALAAVAVLCASSTFASDEAEVTQPPSIDTALVANIRAWMGETHHGSEHVTRWQRVLAALGHGEHADPMSAAEAKTYVDRGWGVRWKPVYDALVEREAWVPPAVVKQKAPSPSPQNPLTIAEVQRIRDDFLAKGNSGAAKRWGTVIAALKGEPGGITAAELESWLADAKRHGWSVGKTYLPRAIETLKALEAQRQQPTPKQGSGPSTAEEPTHNVILRVVKVPVEWSPFVHNGGGWSSAVMERESEHLKYFEAAIWLGERAVHLYEFDDSFKTSALGMTPEAWTAHRESYRVMRIAGLPLPPPDSNYSPQISHFLREAFKDIASYIVSAYPDSEHHLMYHGHGGSGGHLFEYQLFYEDANEMLSYWTAALGRPLGVIDMGGPCTKGGYEDLTNFCQHARFYIASDMINGGFDMDNWTYEKFEETDIELQYHRLFADAPTLRDALAGRLDVRRKKYEYARHNMIATQWMQALYLYSCQEFVSFSRLFLASLKNTKPSWEYGDDLLEFLKASGAASDLLEAFGRIISYQIDNRDFFAWPESRNGILLPVPQWLQP